ncbi:MAG: exodeoxyribonuclease III [Nanoarchaeota archaeon]|nr:exodeoxyribonuclease III [Nanoarchaeota archaeon]MBU1501287.1 exodeoxyribonuclease III [Nanoarchaeota archaeon]
MKILSWNVNGIRAILKKGFMDFIIKENPDILCLQETKAHPEQVDIVLQDHPHRYWNSAERKGYSSVAVFSKIKPISITKEIGHELDNEGRVLALEFENFYLVNVYVPNSGRGLSRLETRKEWDKIFHDFVKSIEKKKPVVICGDLNVAHKEIDLANPKSNYNKTAGYTQTEIDGFQEHVNAGFVDTFREFNKEPGNYTYWGVWNNLRARNVGWRIDYFLASKSFLNNIKNSFILPEVMGSDHCPVGVELI